jgi:hypothetical protein
MGWSYNWRLSCRYSLAPGCTRVMNRPEAFALAIVCPTVASQRTWLSMRSFRLLHSQATRKAPPRAATVDNNTQSRVSQKCDLNGSYLPAIMAHKIQTGRRKDCLARRFAAVSLRRFNVSVIVLSRGASEVGGLHQKRYNSFASSAGTVRPSSWQRKSIGLRPLATRRGWFVLALL